MNHKKTALTIALLFLFSIFSFAQNPTVEANFAPALSKISVSNITTLNQAIQSDGKIVVAGSFSVVNGVIKGNVARLNVDGTSDTTFNCPACTFQASTVLIQPDGKILVGGTNKLIRLNSDGSLDNSFSYVASDPQNVEVRAIQPDGKPLIVIARVGIGGPRITLYRLNTNGSFDSNFTTLTVLVFSNQILKVKVLPDGRTFVFGDTSYGYLALLNADGSKNTAFESPALTPSGSFITDIALQPDGKIAFIGKFTAVNGVSRTNIARLNTNQSVDSTFNTNLPFLNDNGINEIYAVSNNKLLIGTNALDRTVGRVQRLNNDGSTDNTFTPITNINNFYSLLLDASERIYVNAEVDNGVRKILRYSANGIFDPSYSPAIDYNGSVRALGLQPDGKILVGGDIDRVNGFNRVRVSRINSDGTTDTTFDTGQKFSGAIRAFAVQTDGKIIVAGAFNYSPIGDRKFIRLNADGSLDTGFNTANPDTDPSPGIIFDVALQSDGKILIAGDFTTVNGTAKRSLARLNSDGSLDTPFNVQLGSTARLNTLAIQPDGKILIGGSFSGVNGFNRTNIARLNTDGTLDTAFNATLQEVFKILIQPDGKYFASERNYISKLNLDGSRDSSFNFPLFSGSNDYITGFALLNDNSIVVGGLFSTIGETSKNNIVRLNPNGSVNLTSFPVGLNYPGGADPLTFFLKQTDGKLLVGGSFTKIEGVTRTGLARLTFSQATSRRRFDFDGDGRADIGVFRPSSNVWYQLLGPNYQFTANTFGTNGDIVAPADFDGDGKTDLGIFRPSTGTWWYSASSAGGAFRAVQFGQSGDIPLPSDVDGNGKDDFVVFRPSNNSWYRLTDGGVSSTFVFGTSGDKPLIGDFDGDGKADYAIYRPSTGQWWYAASSAGNAFRATQWGIAEDIPVPADYDGDGKTDLAVYRPSNNVWYILNSGNSSATIIQFGSNGDKPVAADYDGDGKADIAVYRPSTGEWYLLRSTAGFTGLQFGISEDIPIPAAYNR